MNNKKIISVLTALLIVAMAVPVFADGHMDEPGVTGEVTSKVDFEDDGSEEDSTTTTLALADGTLNLEGVEDLTASLGFLNEIELDGETTTEINPDVAYTGIENVTAGIIGALDDDKWIVMKNDAGTTEIATKIYADYEVEAMEGLTVGSEDNVVIKNEDATGDDATTTLTIKPYANYKTMVAEDVTVGSDNSFEYATLDGDTQELVINPYVAIEKNLDKDLVATFDANYEIKALDAETQTLNITPTVEYTAIPNITAGVKGSEGIDEDELYMLQKEDSEDLEVAVEVYADYEVMPMEGVTTGVENSVVADGTTDALDKSAVMKPYVNYEKPLADNLTLVSENSYELVYDNEETNGTLNLMGGVNYTF